LKISGDIGKISRDIGKISGKYRKYWPDILGDILTIYRFGVGITIYRDISDILVIFATELLALSTHLVLRSNLEGSNP